MVVTFSMLLFGYVNTYVIYIYMFFLFVLAFRQKMAVHQINSMY